MQIHWSLENCKGELRKKRVKTTASRRTIPVLPFILDGLRRYRQGIECPLFADFDGGYLRRWNVHDRHWKPLLRRAG